MPLRDFKCTKCDLFQERFFHSGSPIPFCSCGGDLEMQPLTNTILGKTGVFPFTSTHLDGHGTPITVENIGHLRSLEKKYGVSVHAFSQNPGNPDSPRDLPRQRPGGREYGSW